MSRKNLILFVILAVVGLPALGFVAQGITRSRQGLPTSMGGSVPGFADSMMERDDESESKTRMLTLAQEKPMMQGSGDLYVAAPRDRMGIMPQPYPASDDFAPGENRLIVKNASLGLVVESISGAMQRINDIAKSEGALITNSQLRDQANKTGATTGSISLRVPVEKLDGVLEQLRKLASRVMYEQVSASDETKQRVDLEAQLRNLRATEAQLLVIMKQARNVSETLQVQQQLTQTQDQVERLDAQLKNLESNAAMSAVRIELSTKEADLPVVGPQERSIVEEFKIAARDALRLYRTHFIQGMRTVILWAPILVLGLMSWLIWRRRQSRVK